MSIQQRMPLIVAALTLSAVISGCSNNDDRVVQVATESTERQAEQNRQMARIASQAAEGSRKLVEADAESRRDAAKVHQQLQAERADLARQWNDLDSQRQEIAEARRTLPSLVPAIETAGAIAVALLAIGFCMMQLFGLRRSEGADAEVSELLLQEMAGDRPKLLSSSKLSLLPTDRQQTDSSPP